MFPVETTKSQMPDSKYETFEEAPKVEELNYGDLFYNYRKDKCVKNLFRPKIRRLLCKNWKLRKIFKLIIVLHRVIQLFANKRTAVSRMIH